MTGTTVYASWLFGYTSCWIQTTKSFSGVHSDPKSESAY